MPFLLRESTFFGLHSTTASQQNRVITGSLKKLQELTESIVRDEKSIKSRPLAAMDSTVSAIKGGSADFSHVFQAKNSRVFAQTLGL